MNKISNYFSRVIRTVLTSFFIICSLKIFFELQYTPIDLNTLIYTAIIMISVLALMAASIIKSEYIRLVIVIGIGLILRVLWVVNYKTYPISDYYTIYMTADEVLNKNFSVFYGTSYFARFPHLTVMTLYISFLKMIFGSNTFIAVKGINLILGALTIYLIYVLCKKISGEKSAYFAALLIAVFPPLITYTGIMCTENIAIPLYLVSIIFFYDYLQSKKLNLLVLCGIFLGFGNLFRAVAAVVLIAYSMYIAVFEKGSSGAKIIPILITATSYILVIASVSTILKFSGITENHLWCGEPKSTNILKGVNFETGGRWGIEDGDFIDEHLDDYRILDDLCKKKIASRLNGKKFTQICMFYANKLLSQWTCGDCGGVMLSNSSTTSGAEYVSAHIYKFFPFQVMLGYLFLVSAFGILNNTDKKLDFVYILFGGYILAFLITECQPRYALISIWLITIILSAGLEASLNKI